MPLKPSEQEEEYVRRQEADLLAKRRRAAEAKRDAEERAKAKELHWMKCPKCGQDLQEERYHRIKVDRCSTCGGIWFDSGEAESLLDKPPGAVQSLFGDLFKGIGGSPKRK